MTQKPASNKRIARQKKAQAGFSLVGGTLGLAALASRGKASQLTRASKTSANGPKLVQQAAKWKDRSTALTTAGAGVGGVGAYNFASYTNADAKRQAKLKKNADPFGISKKTTYDYNKDAAKKDKAQYAATAATGVAASGVGGALAGHEAGRQIGFTVEHNMARGLKTPGSSYKSAAARGLKSKKGRIGVGLAAAGLTTSAVAGQRGKKSGVLVKKNADPFGVSKLGGPKVKFQEITSYSQGKNTTTRHDADTVTTHYKGKSLILRRPKYQAVAHPSDATLKRSSYASATPNARTTRKAAATLAEAHEKKSKTVKLGTHKVKHQVSKADTVSAFGINHGW